MLTKAPVTTSVALVTTSFFVTTSKALVPSSVALVSNSFLLLLVRHLLLLFFFWIDLEGVGCSLSWSVCVLSPPRMMPKFLESAQARVGWT